MAKAPKKPKSRKRRFMRFRKHAEEQRRLLQMGSLGNTGTDKPPTTVPFKRPRVCLLCSSICYYAKPKVNSQLVDKLFCIPVEEVQTKYNSSLEKPFLSYINFCTNCIYFVQDYDGVYEESKRIEERIREIENQLKTKIQKSQPLLKDIFKENTILCQLYKDIRSNFCPLSSSQRSQQPVSTILKKIPVSTKNTASFLNLGMVVPSFDFENVETMCINPEGETQIKVEAIKEDDEEPNWDAAVESVSGNDSKMSGELQLNSESPNLLNSLISHQLPHVDTKVKDDVPVFDSSNFNSRKVYPSKRSPKQKSVKLDHTLSCGTSSTSKKLSTKQLFKCLLCGKQFITEHSVTVHMESKHSKKPNLLRKTVKENDTCRTILSEYDATPIYISCPEAECTRMFQTELGLRKHLTFAHNYPANTYNCDFCSYQTKIRQRFTRHRQGHTGEKPHVCYFCVAAYGTKERLIIHTRQHTLERPYCCNICHKDFTSTARLSRHKQIHTEERLFLCSICGKRSKTANNLYIHMWSHDPSQKHRYSNSKSKRMKKSAAAADAADKTYNDKDKTIVPPESTTAASVVQQKEIAKSNTVSSSATTLSSSTVFNLDSQKVVVVDAGAEDFHHHEPVTSEAHSLVSSNSLQSSNQVKHNDFSFPIVQ